MKAPQVIEQRHERSNNNNNKKKLMFKCAKNLQAIAINLQGVR
jgi:hypothetical protein